MGKLIDEASVVRGLPGSVPVMAHVPHAATAIPARYRSQFVLSDEQLRGEIERLTDWHTGLFGDRVAALGGVTLNFPFSRFFLDPERFEDDEQEPMARVGMGAVYTHDTQRRRLRRQISAMERHELLEQVYFPYHKLLNRRAAELYARFRCLLIIDCHSYPTRALPYEAQQETGRPELCIGTHPEHSPGSLVETVRELAAGESLDCAVNVPFAGCLVPSALLGNPRVSAVMLEVRRSVYMDEETLALHAGIGAVERLITGLCHSFLRGFPGGMTEAENPT